MAWCAQCSDGVGGTDHERRRVLINYRGAQPTLWAPAILDYMKKVKSSISTVVLAPNSSSDGLRDLQYLIRILTRIVVKKIS